MTDPMTVDPQPEELELQEPQAIVVNAPDPLGLLNELPPDYAIKLKPNDRIRILTKDGQDDVTYPIGGAAPTPEPEPPPDGPAAETGVLNADLNDSDNTVVALMDKPLGVPTVFQIDSEYMDVVDNADPNNPVVARATRGSTIAAHIAGTQVSIWEA